MIGTLYLHPKRSVAATWDSSEGTNAITKYADFQPVSSLVGASVFGPETSEFFEKCDEVRVILHSSEFVFHRFPISTTEDIQRRVEFEIGLLSPLHRSAYQVIDTIPQHNVVFGSRYLSVTCAKKEQFERAMHGEFTVSVCTDLMCDITAALPTSTQPVVVVGTRGNKLWSANVDHSGVGYIDVSNVETASSLIDPIVEAVRTCRSLSKQLLNRVTLFGDDLTRELLEGVKEGLKDHGMQVYRHSPFSKVRSELTVDQSAQVLKRAHVIGPLVGALLNPSSHSVQ